MKVTLVTNPVDRDGYFFPGFTITVEDDKVETVRQVFEIVLDLYKPPMFIQGDDTIKNMSRSTR
ncbi:MAG: hypothetical protein V3W37_06380 [Candidatus Binatia bacterium]